MRALRSAVIMNDKETHSRYNYFLSRRIAFWLHRLVSRLLPAFSKLGSPAP